MIRSAHASLVFLACAAACQGRLAAPASTSRDDGGAAALDGSNPAGDASTAPGHGDPTLLADAPKLVETITVDGDDLYLGCSDELVARVSKSGGALVVLDEHAPGQTVDAVAVDARYIYWAVHAARSIRRAPKAGGPVESVAENEDGPISVALDANHIYWANLGATGGGGVARKLRSSLPGGAIERFGLGSDVSDWVGAVGTSMLYAAGDRLYRLDDGVRPGVAIVDAMTDVGETWGPTAVTPTGVVWARHHGATLNAESRVVWLPAAGGAPTPIATGAYQVTGLAGSATRVAIVRHEGASGASSLVVRSLSGQGADAEIVRWAYGPGSWMVTATALDDKNVYFAETKIGGNAHRVRAASLPE